VVLYSSSRKAKDEESIAAISFRTDKKYSFKVDEALEILNQKGRFETRFQSFMSIGGKEFIIVSAFGKDPYYSVLAIQPDDKVVQALKKNEKKYLNKLLKVEFEEVTESNGFTFQGLIKAEIVEE
jgi:nitrous oxide reductase